MISANPVKKSRRRYWKQSFAQEGEDLILASVFEGQKSGFYVDVGAYHPKRFSNTQYFYLRGWRGINIDATPGSMKAFRRVRPEDINIEAAISDQSEALEYFIFNEAALNTFDAKLAAERDGFLHFTIVRRISIATQPLSQILERHLRAQTKIDFLSVDAEGFDLAVLRSSDWERYSPSVVLVEDTQAGTLQRINDSAITAFMRGHRYEPFAATFRTVFYRRPS
jgi:FkbM family methyltransferase